MSARISRNAGSRALKFEQMSGHLKAERGGLGVHAVRAACGESEFMFTNQSGKRVFQACKARQQNDRGFTHL